jgi:caffeoyl-CoA O-methyltransferase
MRGFAAAVVVTLCCGIALVAGGGQQSPAGSNALDARVKAFLDQHRGDWHDLNVPESDGELLHDLVLKGGYKRALEIGTSTGRSGIWIAWALSKTGGKLITVDIDEGRHDQAVRNFQEAGVSAFIDARLADAHDLVPTLDGPFDFVFIDADKEWYTNYAKAVIPKLAVGGCLAAHNVYQRRGWGGGGMTGDYYQYVSSLPFLETTVTPGGVAMSYKRRNQ